MGSSQQRLSRELEKLTIALHPGAKAGAADVERCRGRQRPQVYDLADALVAGDLRETLALAEELESHGERAGGSCSLSCGGSSEVHRAAALLESGMPEQKVAGRSSLRHGSPRRRSPARRRPTRAALEHAI